MYSIAQERWLLAAAGSGVRVTAINTSCHGAFEARGTLFEYPPLILINLPMLVVQVYEDHVVTPSVDEKPDT